MVTNPYAAPESPLADGRNSLTAPFLFLASLIVYFVTLHDVWLGSGTIAGMAHVLRTTTHREDLVVLIEAAISGSLGAVAFHDLAHRLHGKAARIAYAGLLVCVTLGVISIGLLPFGQGIRGMYLIPLTAPFVFGAMALFHLALARFEARRPLACWAILGVLVATAPCAFLEKDVLLPIGYGHNTFRLSREGIKGVSVTLALVTICSLLAWRLRAIGKTWRETAPGA